MTILEHEPSPEEADTQFRNTTYVAGLEDFLKSVGHPEVEQHMQTITSAGNLALKESVYSD